MPVHVNDHGVVEGAHGTAIIEDHGRAEQSIAGDERRAGKEFE